MKWYKLRDFAKHLEKYVDKYGEYEVHALVACNGNFDGLINPHGLRLKSPDEQATEVTVYIPAYYMEAMIYSKDACVQIASKYYPENIAREYAERFYSDVYGSIVDVVDTLESGYIVQTKSGKTEFIDKIFTKFIKIK